MGKEKEYIIDRIPRLLKAEEIDNKRQWFNFTFI